MNIKNILNKELFFIIFILIISRCIFLILTPIDIGSFDLRGWKQVADILLAGQNPYNLTDRVNWAPFWLQMLFLMGNIAEKFNIHFYLVVKLILIFFEVLLVSTLFIFFKKIFQAKKIFLYLIIGISLNPICIFQVCQHGNFDVVIAYLMLLFIFSFICYVHTKDEKYWLFCTLFLGLGIWVKTVPFCLVPFLFFRIKNISNTNKIFGSLFLFGPVFISMSVIFVLGPDYVTNHVLKYRSFPSWFGITGLLYLLRFDRISFYYIKIFPKLYYILLILCGYYFYKKKNFPISEVLSIIILLLLTIVTLGTGYGPQYIYWYIPLFICFYSISNKTTRILLIFTYIVAIGTYFIEYSFFISHGKLLLRLYDYEILTKISNKFSTQRYQNIIRLPLFFIYGILMINIFFKNIYHHLIFYIIPSKN